MLMSDLIYPDNWLQLFFFVSTYSYSEGTSGRYSAQGIVACVGFVAIT